MPTERLGTRNVRSTHYPRFSEAEYERRWAAVRERMDEEGLDAIILYTGSGDPNIHYLTNILTIHTYLVFFADPDEEPTAWVGHNNNVQFGVEVSTVDDVRAMVPDPVGQVTERINDSSAAGGSVGLVGLAPRYSLSLPYGHYQTFESDLDAELADATEVFPRLLATKSEEELEWLDRAGDYVADALEALIETAAPGVTEYELAAEMEHAYRKDGGRTGITYLTSAPMEDPEPGECLPWREVSGRTVQTGDVINDEFSASHWGYGVQMHRPISVGRPPTEQYEDLFEVARESYEQMRAALRPGNTVADVHEGLAPIEESEYKIYDVAVHSYGNVYGPPHVGTEGSDYWPGIDDPTTGEWTFEENEVIVLQPNPITADERYGLQLGNTLVIREDGPEELVDHPLEFVEV